MTQTKLNKYAEIIKQIKELKDQQDQLNREIMNDMNTESITNYSTGQGEFILAWRKSWEYTAKTQSLELQLKEAKRHEEAVGTAVISNQTEYLSFRGVK